jgi:hypothetical protein
VDRERLWALIEETRDNVGDQLGEPAAVGLDHSTPGSITTAGGQLAFPALVQDLLDSGKDCCRQAARLAVRLHELPAAEIAAFYDGVQELELESYRWDLWGAAYLINGGCSDSGFREFCGWLLGQGRAVFEAVLSDPDSLADHPDVRDITPAMVGWKRLGCAELLAAAFWVHESVTGQDPPEHPQQTQLSERWGRGPVGEDWDFDDDQQIRRRYPRLWARLGWVGGA